MKYILFTNIIIGKNIKVIIICLLNNKWDQVVFTFIITSVFELYIELYVYAICSILERICHTVCTILR